jgi:hypothetical protein
MFPIDLENYSVVDPDPHPRPFKIRIRIRIKVISWMIRINLQMTSQNVWNMSSFENFFKGFSPYLESRVWIHIRVRVESRIRISIT